VRFLLRRYHYNLVVVEEAVVAVVAVVAVEEVAVVVVVVVAVRTFLDLKNQLLFHH